MPHTPEELEFLKSGAEKASALLPAARRGLARLSALVKLYEDTIAAFEATQANDEPPPKGFAVKGIMIPSERAARGEAQDRILRIMEKSPNHKAKDIQTDIELMYGVKYGLSTIYRVMGMVMHEAARQQEKEEDRHENEQSYLKAKPPL